LGAGPPGRAALDRPALIGVVPLDESTRIAVIPALYAIEVLLVPPTQQYSCSLSPAVTDTAAVAADWM
jgi:hypothetical protein